MKIEFQKAILDAQLEAESTIMRPFVSDRCLLDPIAYTLYKNPGVDGSNHRMLTTLPAVQSFLASYRDSTETLIILLEPVKEFAQDDGTRSQVGSWEDWMECNRCFKTILRDTGMQWSTLGPETVDLGARVEMVKVLLKDAMRRRG
jgi:AAA domain